MKRPWLWTAAAVAAALLAVQVAGHRLATSQPRSPGKKVAIPTAGAATYRTSCLSCHGPDGNGHGLVELPDGDLAPALASLSPSRWSYGRLSQMITQGDPPMPAWGNVLTARQIQSVTTYVEYLMARRNVTAPKTPKAGPLPSRRIRPAPTYP